MNRPERALLLVGSPRGRHSTSAVLGTYLLNRLREVGLETAKVQEVRSAESQEGFEAFLPDLEQADLLILSFPLYVDTLPAIATRFLERLAESRIADPESKRLVAIANCGFPEAWQNDTALAICRKFAGEMGLKWAGGLALGGGTAIDGRPLEALGGLMRNVRQALDLAAVALAAGHPVPRKAVDLMAKPFMPAWAYLCLGAMGRRRHFKSDTARPLTEDP